MHAIARLFTARDLRLSVEGLEHLPRRGPALIASRHYHHLHDGVALVELLPRWPHVVVALDWTRTALQRRAMETLCRLAEWPVVLREERLVAGAPSAFDARERTAYLRRSLRESARLLCGGHVVVVFPEGYPTVDPERNGPRADAPFRSGFLGFVSLAERSGAQRIPILPAGFAYVRSRRWDVTLRLGAPLFFSAGDDRRAVCAQLEARVRALSA
jgi:putative membrane protein